MLKESNKESENKKESSPNKSVMGSFVIALLLILVAMVGWCTYENILLVERIADKVRLSTESSGNSQSFEEIKKSIDYLQKSITEIRETELTVPDTEISISSLDFFCINQKASEQSLAMALSGEYGFEETEALFINSMNVNPDNLKAFDSYWSWVEENCYDTVRVSFFLNIIESSMYKCSPENVSFLSNLYNEVSDSLQILVDNVSVAPEVELPKEAVETTYMTSDLEGFRKAFTEYLEIAGELDEEPDNVKEFMQKYESAYIAVSRYKLISEQNELLSSLSDSIFMTAYPSSFAEFLSNLQEISNLKENDALAKKAFAEAESMANGWNTRYNSILVEKVETDYLSIKNGKVSDKEKFNELSMIYSSELVSLYNLNIVDTQISAKINILGQAISNTLTDLQKTMYKDYQVGAAMLINKIKNEIGDIEKKKKLEYLYKVGYFNIDQDLLFPELREVFSAIFDNGYVKNSILSEAELQVKYPVDRIELGDL